MDLARARARARQMVQIYLQIYVQTYIQTDRYLPLCTEDIWAAVLYHVYMHPRAQTGRKSLHHAL